MRRAEGVRGVKWILELANTVIDCELPVVRVVSSMQDPLALIK